MVDSRVSAGAGSTGTRFLSVGHVLAPVLFCLLLASPTLGANLTGSAGALALQAQAPVSVRFESLGEGAAWHISVPEEITLGYTGGEVRKEKGGIVIVVPFAAAPSLVWTAKGIEVRWSVGRGDGDFFVETEPPTYPLGPGDKLQITVYNVEDMDKTVIVDPKGNITLPVLDKIKVDGLTVTEFQKDMEQRLKQYIREPQVGIQVLEYGSRYVNVLGEVGAPGRIAIKGALRVLDAVSQAGGFKENSGDIEIQRRGPSGEIRTHVILKESLLTGDKTTFNVFVHDQDVLNVRPIKSVYVSGEVKNPGSFPFVKGMTLLKAIAKAGDFSQWARKGKVDILREAADGSNQTIHVDASDIEKGKIPDVPIQPNDHIVVRERKLF
jgi:polysaccharide biosynthesis/export protein